MSKESPLLQPLPVGGHRLKNRIMFPPLTTGYEERDGSIGPRSFHFYQRLARGGAGYIVIGDVAPVRTASPTPKLFDDRQIPALGRLADALHTYDCKLAVQIFHPEYDVPGVNRLIDASRAASQAAREAEAAGDSALAQSKAEQAEQLGREARAKLRRDMDSFVNEATPEQLQDIKKAMVDCARRAALAGVDAIEIHGDRLLGSLCSELLNHRQDAYGGSFENRVRYALEVAAAIRAAVPSLIVEYKLPVVVMNDDGSLRGRGGLQPGDAGRFAVLLEQAGVDMIQVAQANHTSSAGDTIPPMGTVDYCWTLPVAAEIKKLVSIPVATVGRVVTVERGEEILRAGQADVIGYGRSLLTDPDIALKVERDEPVRTCLNCNKGCVDAISRGKYISCVLNAENGEEQTVCIRPGEGRKRVVVVGAGIAGLEAARVAAKRGYTVTVYDIADKVGGQLLLAAAAPRKAEILRAVAYYESILPTLGVEIKLGRSCTPEEMNRCDVVIAAVGARNITLSVPGAEGPNVVSAWDVLAGKVKLSGRCAVIGGGLVGAEAAQFLAERGCQAAVIEMKGSIAAGESAALLPLLQRDFDRRGVERFVKTKVTAITPTAVEAVNIETGQLIAIPCDWAVMAVGSQKMPFDQTGITVPVKFVGDCSGEHTATIAEAVRSGYHAANGI